MPGSIPCRGHRRQLLTPTQHPSLRLLAAADRPLLPQELADRLGRDGVAGRSPVLIALVVEWPLARLLGPLEGRHQIQHRRPDPPCYPLELGVRERPVQARLT